MKTIAVVFAALVCVAVAASAPPKDHAAVSYSVLPPGENGSVSFDRNTNDQVKLYDGLTPRFDQVTAADLKRYFKPAPLGLAGEKPAKTKRLRPGVTIRRDRFGVPHVDGKTQEDVAFGAGFATAEDRGLLLALIRGPARISALDVPGLDPLALALSGRSFVPSAQTEAFLAKQVPMLEATGARGKLMARLLRSYVAGINAYYRSINASIDAYTTNDVIAAAALIAARFGANGGQEGANAQFLSALQTRLGADQGRRVFDDLHDANDPEAPVSVPGSFPYELPVTAAAAGSVVLDDGSYTTAPRSVAAASNAILIGASRSATGHPIFVAGPQVGYFFPQFFMEVDLAGGGINARGALFPGVPFVVIGRGKDFVWSATSAQSDNIDLFAETLCGDDAHYLYKGVCTAMTTFRAGTLKSASAPDQEVSFRETVHGPVQGYATVAGRRVAISLSRATRGRELLSAQAFHALNQNEATSAKSFLTVISRVEYSFNWFYADHKDIAMFSSGRLPVRAAGTDPALPTVGTGDYDWRGFLAPAAHAQGVSPKSGAILNWNNKPAPNVGSADSNFSYGSVQRVDLFTPLVAAKKRHTVVDVVSIMNKAATQDLRVMRLLPVLKAVLESGPAPSPRAAEMLKQLEAWRIAGGSRLDRDLDGRIDHPGAAIMDAVWPRLADAAMSPVLGPLVDRLAQLMPRSDNASPTGSAYIDGWYGYVDKDLRTLLGQPVKGPFKTRFCGGGDLGACRASLWGAFETAGASLQAAQGANVPDWRADANPERIRFTSGVLQDTMRWTNRPTFQQVISFSTHR